MRVAACAGLLRSLRGSFRLSRFRAKARSGYGFSGYGIFGLRLVQAMAFSGYGIIKKENMSQ